MTDIMLQGVLRMPYEMAMENEWSRRQFHDRAKQAADRIEELEGIVRELLHRIDGSMVFITSRQKINPEYGPGWIAEATDRARAALGE